MLAIAIPGAIWASQIIGLSAPGLGPEKSKLAGDMLTILIFAVPLHGAASLTQGVQNARGRFFMPAIAPALGSLVNVTLLLSLYPSLGPIALAWGYLGWAVTQACVTVLPVVCHGWDRLISLRDARLLEMAKLVIPLILFGLLTRSTTLVERFFASHLPDGQLSYLAYAHKVAHIVMMLIGAGIATAAFPAMAKAYAREGDVGLVKNSEHAFRLTLATAFPAMTILGALSLPLVTLLFERGAFDRISTLSVSYILPIVMISDVLFGMLGNVLGRTFYVARDTWTFPLVSFVASVIYVPLAMVFVGKWGYVGLAWAKPIIGVGLAIVVTTVLFKRQPTFNRLGLLQDSLKYGVASAGACCAARIAAVGTVFFPSSAQLLTSVAIAGLAYLLIVSKLDRAIAISLLEITGVRPIVERLKLVSPSYLLKTRCARSTSADGTPSTSHEDGAGESRQ
jgi:putative peptidoglycan lipid II flippase